MSHTELYRALHLVLDFLEHHDVDPTALADVALLAAHADGREGGVREMLRAGGWRAPEGLEPRKMSETRRQWLARSANALLARLAGRFAPEDYRDRFDMEAAWVRRAAGDGVQRRGAQSQADWRILHHRRDTTLLELPDGGVRIDTIGMPSLVLTPEQAQRARAMFADIRP